jgi:hypothetical protein|tara:strand:- start:707 stop:898 length:192 start_codon:yes stop_codon:yes gene_type:complete
MLSTGVKMDTTKWKSVAIRKEIVEEAAVIGEKTERPTSNVFAYAVKRLKDDLENGRLNDVPKS